MTSENSIRTGLESIGLPQPALLDYISDGLAIFNEQGCATYRNAQFVQLAGLETVDVHVRDLGVIFSKKMQEFSATVEHVLHARQAVSVPAAFLTRGIGEVVLVPLFDEQNQNLVVIVKHQAFLNEIDQLRSEFVTIASHQLRSPLTALRLFAEMLAGGAAGQLNDLQREYVLNVQQVTANMIRLVDDLLNVSRLESGRLKIAPHLTPLASLIQHVLDKLEPLAQENNCQIEYVRPPQELPSIYLDVNLIQQVIQNLVANAIRYSPTRSCSIQVGLEQRADRYVVWVRDSGIGIPTSAQPRIFQKFFRADNAVKLESEGTGLGLYVSKMIMDASGGDIWFTSQEGRGSTFYISLPMITQPQKSK